jgi:very-short-patch-repair endonuclease
MKKQTPAIEQFEAELEAFGLEYVKEYRFAKQAMDRQWRIDYALLHARILVDIDGATHVAGKGHSTGKGIDNGYEKANAATLLGWRMFRFSSTQVRNGLAFRTVLAAYGVQP